VPHEVLICGIEDGSRHGLAVHRFSSSRDFGQAQFDAVAHATTGLLPRLVTVAEGTRGRVIFCPPQYPSAAEAESELRELVVSSELQNLAAHLVLGTRGTVEGFYGFARLSCQLDARLGYAIALLLPHLHLTFLRVLAHEREMQSGSVQRSGRVVTQRQEEILNLIKTGKTNAEIALALDCSPWTVKNHIQAILRKLDSNSRAHAVSRAISLGVLRAD
jgi:transcriptional regulator EpsA